MKKLLKLYKMFYRLLRLKSEQHSKIERDLIHEFYLINDNKSKEIRELEIEIRQWHYLASRYKTRTPDELIDFIEDLADKLRKAEDTPSNFNRIVAKYNKFVDLKKEFCDKFKDIELEA